jgi:hypothetical protein
VNFDTLTKLYYLSLNASVADLRSVVWADRTSSGEIRDLIFIEGGCVLELSRSLSSLVQGQAIILKCEERSPLGRVMRSLSLRFPNGELAHPCFPADTPLSLVRCVIAAERGIPFIAIALEAQGQSLNDEDDRRALGPFTARVGGGGPSNGD